MWRLRRVVPAASVYVAATAFGKIAQCAPDKPASKQPSILTFFPPPPPAPVRGRPAGPAIRRGVQPSHTPAEPLPHATTYAAPMEDEQPVPERRMGSKKRVNYSTGESRKHLNEAVNDWFSQSGK